MDAAAAAASELPRKRRRENLVIGYSFCWISAVCNAGRTRETQFYTLPEVETTRPE
jgi:hypothetical protein